MAQIENTKEPELAKDGVSFSGAMNSAFEATTNDAPSEPIERSGDKRSSKKTETSKEASGASSLSGPIAQPTSVTFSPQFIPVPPVAGHALEDPLASKTERCVDTVAPRSLRSDSATSDSGGSLALDQEVGDVRSFSIPHGVEKDSVTAVSAKNDTLAEPGMKDTGESSGAILEPPDETSVAAHVVDPSSLVPAIPTPVAAPVDLSADEVGTSAKKQATVELSDVNQIAFPVPLPTAFVAVPLPSAPVPPIELDLNAMTAIGKHLMTETEARDNNLKPNSTAGKDRSISETHVRSKELGSEDETQSVATSMPPVKVSESSVATSHQGNGGQAEGNNPQTSQMVPSMFAQETSQVQTATHATVTPQAAEIATQNVSSAAPSFLDVPPAPTLNGARLIQSVHQTEMKLGMNSAEFGNISISTSVTHQALSAQISLDHAELGRALAAHLPAMEERLGNAYGLQARVEVHDSAASSHSNSSQQPRKEGQSQQSGSADSGIFSSGPSTVAARSIPVLASESSRLDIRI